MAVQGLCGIVTGASRGIGRHLALALGREGAKCVVNYLADAEGATRTVSEIRALGCDAVAIQADVSVPAQGQRLVEQALAHFGRIDFLINNAGIVRDAFLDQMTVEEWDAVIGTNLNGPFYMLKACGPHLIASKGSMINIISRAAFTGFFGDANYAASKAGLIAFSKAAANELGKHGVRVNAISPPFIADGIPAKHPKGARLIERAAKTSLLGVGGAPADLCDFVIYLLARDRHVTGQVFKIDSRFC